MRTDATGRAAIAQREGTRLRAYRDTKGIRTIGVGHTGRGGPPPVTAGMRITAAEADAIFAADLAPTDRDVTAALTRTPSQGQHNAFASIAFNIGGTGFKTSTMVRRFNAGDVTGCADAFLLWSKPPELKARRRAERAQFLAASVQRTGPRPAPHAPPVPPPRAAQHQKVKAMPFFLTLLLALFGATAANAAEVDLSPLVSAGIEYFLVPLVGSAGAWLTGLIGLAAKNYLDQKTALLLAQNVDAVLQKAISFGASQALAFVGNKDLHTNVEGWIASYAVKYANDHAPQLMKQAGDVTQKVFARLAEHPDVAMVNAAVGQHAAMLKAA